ncbi:hypothetical protein BGZ89_005374 [Linnemannia elongata]|nr:hypothetical protein BGZ89_005374 [Linnemannia elongata]KAG0064088.1 hypothetical protein BGZ90_002380 [Linnemannia elongata]
MDYILNTHVGDLPWETFVSLLITNGTLINLGIAAKPSMEIPYMPLLFNQLKVVGSLVASRHVVNKMFEFAARHNIKPEIEEYDMTAKGCREGFKRVTEQKARYRVVLNVPRNLAL